MCDASLEAPYETPFEASWTVNLQMMRIKKAASRAALFKLGAQEGTRTPTKLLAST